MKKQPNIIIIIAAFILIFGAIIYFWFQTTGSHIKHIFNEAKDKDSPVLNQLKEDFSELEEQLEVQHERYKKQKEYLKKKNQEQQEAATSDDDIPQEVLDAIILKLEASTTSTIAE